MGAERDLFAHGGPDVLCAERLHPPLVLARPYLDPREPPAVHVRGNPCEQPALTLPAFLFQTHPHEASGNAGTG